MVRNTNAGSTNWASNEEEEPSIELDLGLSVGGSYSKPKRTVLDPCIGEINDQKTKREIHALRRQEAKKKQQLKRGFSKLTKNGDVLSKANDFEPECKKTKGEENGSDRNLTVDGKFFYCNAAAAAPPVATAENGFVFPCNVMPCWFAGAGAAAGEEKNGAPVNVQPVIEYGFVSLGLDQGLGNGYGSEDNCSGDRGNGKSGSNGSDKCTSSSGSDHRSPCNEGDGNGTSTRSHSSSKQQQQQLNDSKLNETKSNISESTSIDEVIHTYAANVVPSNNTNSTPIGAINQPSSEPEPKPKPENNKCTTEGKPPKLPSRVQTNPPLPHMPCVSTTGNGPNGRTVNGFLYRYTKAEVSIVCVCHGSSFSPAEFVQHAGGTDVLHPLKHITVVSSAF